MPGECDPPPRPPSRRSTLAASRRRCQGPPTDDARQTNHRCAIASLRSRPARGSPSRPRSRRHTAAGIFLGGWTVSAHVYVPGLPPGWACPEQPGFGDTDGRFAAYVDWAAGLVRRHAEPLHLAGHSLGGAVAIAVAAREPGRVHRVTAFGPAGLPVEHGLRQAARDVVANGLGMRSARAPPPARRCAHSTTRAPPSAWPARSSASTSRASSASSARRASSSWS